MTITDKEYGRFEVYLADDGTLDTVIEVTPIDVKGNTQEIRYTFTDDETGTMTDDGFTELAEESVEAYIEQCLI